MEADNIRRLLEQYEAANTSQEDEKILKEYFRREQNIPDEWVPYKLLFDWTDEVNTARLSDSFSNRLKEKLDSSVQNRDGSISARFLKLNPFSRWGIAASLMIAFGFWFLIQERTSNTPEPIWTAENETFDSPEEAYKQTMEALALVSSKMNKGRLKATESIKKLKRLDVVIPN